MSATGRIGMITPSSNTVIEPITQELCARFLPEVTTHFSRVRVVKNSIDADAQRQFTLELMVEAAGLLADAQMDTIVWNGTSAGWLGLDRDRQLIDAIEQSTGRRAGSALLAMIEVMQEQGLERYVLASPYQRAMDDAIIATFAAEGLHCVHADGLDITDNLELGRTSRQQMRDHVRRTAAAADADAIVIPCTNYGVAWVTEELEQELGIPIVDSVLLAAWEGFRGIGLTEPVDGWGRIMATGRASLTDRG